MLEERYIIEVEESKMVLPIPFARREDWYLTEFRVRRFTSIGMEPTWSIILNTESTKSEKCEITLKPKDVVYLIKSIDELCICSMSTEQYNIGKDNSYFEIVTYRDGDIVGKIYTTETETADDDVATELKDIEWIKDVTPLGVISLRNIILSKIEETNKNLSKGDTK